MSKFKKVISVLLVIIGITGFVVEAKMVSSNKKKKEVPMVTKVTKEYDVQSSSKIEETKSSKKVEITKETTSAEEVKETETKETTFEEEAIAPVEEVRTVTNIVEPVPEEKIEEVVEEKLIEVKSQRHVPNSIGINGIFRNYLPIGRGNSVDVVEYYIDGGNIITTVGSYNPHENQTTYFGGHNPGIMDYMEQNLSVGSTVTVTDSNGNPFDYRAVDYTIVDIYGEGILGSIGMSAIDLYVYGSNQRSLAIQYCLSNSDLMIMWYLLPLF
ncbi:MULTISPECIES: hypothetical protein [Vagococcus]|uniref:Uncharacterized protein n=1 Tax=Vagococcus fluvialis bH819 TaxID=1255619 RepID=A0A1X6WLN8_9ENTE|nr:MULTISPECIES: hypothetical protein [Vagococcus]SLM85168.1 hypothetical protein FM121_03655 [Vagococcus fluvialis bH819]HCM88418.1 hypothetical protein [Vagococcus sp.]